MIVSDQPHVYTSDPTHGSKDYMYVHIIALYMILCRLPFTVTGTYACMYST